MISNPFLSVLDVSLKTLVDADGMFPEGLMRQKQSLVACLRCAGYDVQPSIVTSLTAGVLALCLCRYF